VRSRVHRSSRGARLARPTSVTDRSVTFPQPQLLISNDSSQASSARPLA